MYNKIIKALFESVSNQKKFDKTVALVAGSFKPPHFAHLYMVMEYAKIADEVIVIISNPKSGKSLRKTSLGTIITPEISKQIWELYLKKYGLSKKVKAIVSPSPSPIGAMFEYIDSGAVDNNNVILGVSKKDDDLSRFKSVEKAYADNDKVNILTPAEYAVEPFKSNGKNVSATDIRNNIDDFKKVKELLPEKLSDKDVKNVMKILGVESFKEAQEPKVTLDQIIELLSNLGFNVTKDSTGVNNTTASAYMEEDVGYTKVAMNIDIADETTSAANVYITIQTGKHHPVNKIDFNGGSFNMTYEAVISKFSEVKQSFLRQQLRQMASSTEKIYDTLIR